MEQLEQLATGLVVLAALGFLILKAAGLPSPRFGWLFLGGAESRRGSLRGAGGRFVSTAHLREIGPAKRAVIGAVAAADLATLALSASALGILGLQPQTADDPQLTATAAVIVAGVCVLLAARAVNELAGATLIFVVAALTAWAVASDGENMTALLQIGLLALALLSVWPIGAAIFVLEFVQIRDAYGAVGVTLTLVILALVGALNLLVGAARWAWFVVAGVVGVVLVTALVGF